MKQLEESQAEQQQLRAAREEYNRRNVDRIEKALEEIKQIRLETSKIQAVKQDLYKRKEEIIEQNKALRSLIEEKDREIKAFKKKLR